MTRRAFDTFFISAVVLAGAGLRLAGLGTPSLWLDEILGYDLATAAAKQPWGRWLLIFDPEHGPLYYATELAGRFLHPAELSARMAPALFGVAAIAAIWLAARAVETHPAAKYTAAILVAASPLAVYYSREARPYALLLLLTVLLLAALLREARPVAIGVLLFAMVWTTAAGAPLILAVAMTAAIAAAGAGRRFWLRAGGAAVVCSVIVVLAYHPAENLGADQFARLDGSFFRALLESFSVVALDTTRAHRSAVIYLALAVIGAIDLARRNRQQAWILVSMTLLPLAIGIIAIRLMRHFFSVRYVLTALPAYLLLVAVGVAAIAQRIPYRTAAAVVIGILLAAQGWRAAVEEPYHKLDWRTIARTIAAHAHENDAVIAANGWSRICLDFYLRGVAPHLRLFDARDSAKMGEVFAYQNTTSWIVSANAGAEFSEWSCRFPVVLASPMQNFRLQYSPTLYYFLTDRSTPAEVRALRASFGAEDPSLHFGPNEDAFFDPGWGSAEPEEGRWARWAIGKRARIALPLGAPSNRTLTVDLAPVGGPAQRVAISVNDRPISTLTLQSGRAQYTIDVPQSFWRDRVNILTFDFDHATAPADVDARSSDHRPLAARFYQASLAGPKPPDSSAHLIRLVEEGPLLEGSEGGTPLPDYVDPERLTVFVARLGFDPQHALAELLDGRVTLADLAAASLADDSCCTSDDRFLETMFRALLGREISARERGELSARLRSGEPRSTMVRGLVNAGEVREAAFAARR